MSERQRTAELHDPRSALGVLPGDGLERLCMTNLLTSVEDRVYFKDRGSRFLFVSAGWLEAYAPLQQLKEVLGTTDHDIFSAEHADVARADERRIMSTGEPMIAHIVRETYRDRPDSWAHVTKRALRDERGQIVGTWGITRDVTPQVEAEQALRASRAELEASESMRHIMFEGNPQPVFVVDRATMRIVGVNAAAEDRYGYSREEFLAMAITDLWPAEDAAAYLASPSPRADMYLLGFRVGQPLRHVLRDGTITDVEITSKNAIFEGRECRVTSVHDVTERNRAAIELSAARDEAVEASNLKSAFLATISHEIRTPMNGVLGMTELLLDTELDEEQRMLADQVARSGELMLALISDILDISKIEAGQLDVEEVDYALRDT
ncbi:MAG TPA: histidine kinase dimerization/phospho-acceptor domain-containing protein, partial [Solirubrobacteraceae bacterium]|nr:histidine kinase dimerization/phospho-acceptor domain-containing protein [Solirubrobacteraceae bacterium]